MKIIVEIPARAGSQRVKNKNLRLIDGKPMVSYAIEAALGSDYVNDTYVNTEDDMIGQCANELGAKFFKRDEHLSSNSAKQEEFNYDFIQKIKPDLLVMVNPVCPLIETSDINNVIEYFLKNEFDTLITTNDIKLQSFYKNQPININTNQILQPTQDLDPIRVCNWAVTIWRTSVFVESFETKGFASFSGKLGFFGIDPIKSVKVSYEEDFALAESVINSRKKLNKIDISYYEGKSQ